MPRDIAFIHNPKTGGKSIRAALKPFVNNGEWTVFLQNHHRAVEYVNDPKFKGFCFISVVRNPYDRHLSAWKFLTEKPMSTPDRKMGKYLKDNYKDFEDFCLSLKYFPPKDFVHFKPQHVWTHTNFDDELLIDFLMHFETLEDDWHDLLEYLDLDYISLPHKNKTNHDSWEDVYTDDMKESVYYYYEKDFELFDY